jgi:sensor c-di-GMP phosphodiesterase-like protein
MTQKNIVTRGLSFGLLILLIISSLEVSAQPRLRMKSRRLINRTNLVLRQAQVAVQRNQVYTGKLAKAVAHQRYARRMHVRGNFVVAIHHSRRARVLAIAALEANRATVSAELALDPQEAAEGGEPSAASLDQQLSAAEPNAPSEDTAVLNEAFEDVQ